MEFGLWDQIRVDYGRHLYYMFKICYLNTETTPLTPFVQTLYRQIIIITDYNVIDVLSIESYY